MRRAVEASHTADYHRHRAEAAAATASTDHAPGFCQRRVTDAETAIRDIDRRIARATDPTTSDIYGTEGRASYLARLETARNTAIEKRKYWRAQLAAAGPAFTRATIRPGDEVRPRSHTWARVIRCNAQTATVHWETPPLAGMGGRYPYAEITDHRRADSLAPTPIVHLTMTGPDAGRPFCGCNTSARRDAGDTFAHVPYTNADTFLARPDICQVCLAEWNAAALSDDAEVHP